MRWNVECEMEKINIFQDKMLLYLAVERLVLLPQLLFSILV